MPKDPESSNDPEPIGIIVHVGDREFPALFLNESQAEAYNAFIEGEARSIYNPFVEFYHKIQILPKNLQEVATKEFVSNLSFSNFPDAVLLNVMSSYRGVRALASLVIAEDIVTEENANDLYEQFLPLISRVAGKLWLRKPPPEA